MGQIIREILYEQKSSRKSKSGVELVEGRNVVCIPLDYYKGRAAGLDPKTRPFGFHKDTIDNRTFYVNLSFDNNVDMYSATLIQCHTDDLDNESQRCKKAIRFKLKPFGTIGFSDFLLAHTTPTGLCSLGADNIVRCFHLNRDTTISSSSSGIVSGTVGVNIQNVHGVRPPAHTSNPASGERRQWTVEFDTRVRGRLRAGEMEQIMSNRPNFIRSWFTFFPTTSSANLSSNLKESAAASSSAEASSSSSSSEASSSSSSMTNKYQAAMLNHNRSIFDAPIIRDYLHHPNSQSGQHTASLERYVMRAQGWIDDDPSRFFKILEVNEDITYIQATNVSDAFERIILFDQRSPPHYKFLTGGKKKKRKKRKGRKTKKRKSQKKRKRKRSQKRKKRKSKRKNI